MDRQLPVGNKICSTIEKFNVHMILVDHLSNAKHCIDNKKPKSFGTLAKSKKKEKIIVLKESEIKRENQYILNKINHIMKNSQQQCNPLKQTNRFEILKRSQSQQIDHFRKSLNRQYRKKELINLVIENQSLLKRIQQQKSQYDARQWDQQRKETEKNIANISEYPYKDYKPHKTIVQMGFENYLSFINLVLQSPTYCKLLNNPGQNIYFQKAKPCLFQWIEISKVMYIIYNFKQIRQSPIDLRQSYPEQKQRNGFKEYNFESKFGFNSSAASLDKLKQLSLVKQIFFISLYNADKQKTKEMEIQVDEQQDNF